MLIRTIVSSLAFCAVTLGAWADGLQPFDRLSRNNVTLKTSVLSSGANTTGQSIKTDYGTYSKDVSTSKVMQVDVALPKTDGPEIKVEAFAFFKNRGGSQVNCTPLEVTPGEKLHSYTFDITASHRRERWMYADDGKVSEYGTKAVGWIVRAIANNTIVGIAYSSESYREVAGNPAALEKFAVTAPN